MFAIAKFKCFKDEVTTDFFFAVCPLSTPLSVNQLYSSLFFCYFDFVCSVWSLFLAVALVRCVRKREWMYLALPLPLLLAEHVCAYMPFVASHSRYLFMYFLSPIYILTSYTSTLCSILNFSCGAVCAWKRYKTFYWIVSYNLLIRSLAHTLSHALCVISFSCW